MKTENADHRTQKLNFLLLAAAAHLPDPLDFSTLKKSLPKLDLGDDAEAAPKPQWSAYAPKPATVGDRLFHRSARYRRALAEAERAFSKAVERYKIEETARQQRVERLRREHETSISTNHQHILQHNAEIDELEEQVYAGERKAVSEYYTRVFARMVDKSPFPRGRKFAYVPESKLLLIDWDIPSIDIVPREKEFRYDKTTDRVEVYKRRSPGEIRETYQNLLAQMALRAAKSAFRADPNTLVETVVFNGVLTAGVYDEDEENDLVIEVENTVCLFSMRATRHHFNRLDLKDIDPLDVVRRRFSAVISLYPDELVGIDPYLPYELADPDLPDTIEGPNLHTAVPEHMQEIITELLERMGYGVKVLAVDDSDLDFLAARSVPEGQELHVVHVRRVTSIADPADVRELYQAVRRERADAGTLLVTGGFDPRSYEYANGKPLHLLDGYGLVALCRRHGITVHVDRESTAPAVPHQRLPTLPQPLRIGR